MLIIEAIANDLKISIDDLIHEIKEIHQDLQKVKQKVYSDETNKEITK